MQLGRCRAWSIYTFLESRILRLRSDLLAPLRVAHDPVARTVEEGLHAPQDASTTSEKQRGERSTWAERLYESVDCRGLRDAGIT